MPLFKKAIVEEVPPSTYTAIVVERLQELPGVAPIKDAIDQYIIPTTDAATEYVNSFFTNFVENRGVYILTLLFLLCAIVLCTIGQPSQPAYPSLVVDNDEQEEEEVVDVKEKEAASADRAITKVPTSISMDDSAVTELTTELTNGSYSSASSGNDDDDDENASASTSSVEYVNNEEIYEDDDHSVEETYDDFLHKVTNSEDDMDIVDAVAAAVADVVANEDEDEIPEEDDMTTVLETPTSSPPTTPERAVESVDSPTISTISDDSPSISSNSPKRTSTLKKRLSSSIRRNMSSSSLRRNMSSNSLSSMSRRMSFKKLSVKD